VAEKLSRLQEPGKWALAQCRAEGPDLSAASVRGTKILIECRCACPGATAITSLSWVQEQKQKV